MRRNLVPRFLAMLELSRMTDPETHALVADVQLAAKTSQIVQGNPTIQASAAALATKDAALATNNQTVAADRAKLHVDVGAEAVARSDVLGELRTYATLVTNVAKSYADIHAAGLPPLGPRQPRNTPPTVPVAINTRIPKRGHGKITVYVDDPGQHRYVAQQSTDETNWTALGIGYGKTRVLTGASGTKVWVRFAMVRGQLVSDWSTAVLVTIP